MSDASPNPGEALAHSEPTTPVRSDQPIRLVDHTKTVDDDEPPDEVGLQKSSTLTQKLTHNSLRQNLARRNYQRTRWQEGGREANRQISHLSQAPTGGSSRNPDASGEAQDDDTSWGEGRVQRNRRRVKELVKAPKKKYKHDNDDPDSNVDILYENQRGFFLFGIPHFSSNSLLNFDPPPWQDVCLRPSAVDITNAQVPDPSWEWSWRTWYVDMSHDIDEEGWEYSFWFGKKCSWHGTHPLFHSFVRRRRWLRLRTRRHGHRQGDKQVAEGHALNADYFTIHSEALPRSSASSLGTSEMPPTNALEHKWGAKTWGEDEEDIEVVDIPSLMKHLKESAIDREKMGVVRRFLDHGGDELFYLAEQVGHVYLICGSRADFLS
jgi:hypothetical protein